VEGASVADALSSEPGRGLLSLVILLLAVGLITWLLYRRLGPVLPQGESVPFLEHVEELRARLIRMLLIWLMWTTVFLSFRAAPLPMGNLRLGAPVPSLFNNVAAQVYSGLARAVVPDGVQVIVASPTEAISAQLLIALSLALVVSAPLLLFEIWAFAAPALRARERVLLARTLPIAFALFGVGAAFAFWMIVPLLLAVLYGFAEPLGAIAFLSATALVGTVAITCALAGVAFELPLVMVGLVRLGLVAPSTYLRRWRHATLVIFILAALGPDPTLTSQLVLGGLLLVLYFGGVAASFAFVRPERNAARANSGKA
jgi:sec-independent protein translocase protein TatC